VLDGLRELVGAEHVLVDADVRAGYEVDWTGRFRGATPAVVRPASVDEVAAVVAYCRAEGIAVVPQGGNTGLVGGSVPLDGEVVLSLRRLSSIGPVDDLAGQVTMGAGVTLGALQAAVAPGWSAGLDLAARDSATIGGMVATNAGGTSFVRHGGMRARLAGIEAVLGDGSIVRHLGGLAKDNTGYDLAGLLCGSEGTLGVVTAARLQLVVPPRNVVTALCAVDGVEGALRAVRQLRAAVPVDAAELVLDEGLQLVRTHLGLPQPVTAAPAYLVLEWDGAVEALRSVEVLDAVVAEDEGRRQALWRYRDAQTEAVNAVGVPHKFDVTLPPPGLARFVDEVRTLGSGTTIVFGHVADGNLHVNVLGDDDVDDDVLRLVAGYGGSISAEHGIGTAKKRWLHLVRSEAEIAAFRAIKRALDPAGILNPNVLLPPL
jgi:FAD/FMN-containing dehydrogenase